MSFMGNKNNLSKWSTFLKRVVACLVITGCLSTILAQLLIPAMADVTVGTQQALGSPVLNQQSVSDDWNPHEAVVWGIFLSNFTTPFVDDYQSAFTKTSAGSQGRGLDALCFSTGSDATNNKVIQDLLTYAISYQKKYAKPVYVSYIDLEYDESSDDFPITQGDAFGFYSESNSSATTSTATPDPDPDPASTTSTGTAYTPTSSNTNLRAATLKDIFISDLPDEPNITTGGNLSIKILVSKDAGSASLFDKLHLPIFAVNKNNTDGGTLYQRVLDYNSSYDASMIVSSISNGLSSSFKDEAVKNINNFLDMPLVIDAFGNLCVSASGRYIVVYPVCASKYATSEESINLLNSLVFSASRGSSAENILVSGGNNDSVMKSNIKKTYDSREIYTAFSNNASSKNAGSVIFYDSASIIWKNRDNPNAGYAKMLKDLFNAEINFNNGNIPLRIEPYNLNIDDVFSGDGISDDLSDMINNTLKASYQMGIIGSDKGVSDVLDYFLLIDDSSSDPNKQHDMFTQSYIVPVTFPVGKSGSDYNEAAVMRYFLNYLYAKYKGQYTKSLSGNDDVSFSLQTFIRNTFDKSSGSDDAVDLLESLLLSSEDKFSELGKYFIYENDGRLYKLNADPDLDSVEGSELIKQMMGYQETLHNYQYNMVESYNYLNYELDYRFDVIGVSWYDSTSNLSDIADYLLARPCKVFIPSPEVEAAAMVLSIKPGTEFAAMAPSIYYTYLKWYDVKKLPDGSFESDINMNLVNSATVIEDITEITESVVSEEEKEREIMNYAYLELHPTDGREYRNQILIGNISAFCYDLYNRIVYGGSDMSYYGNVTTQQHTGFLSIASFEDNFIIGPILRAYTKVAIVIIAASTFLTIIIAIIKRRKLTWVFVNIAITVIIVLSLPASADLMVNVGDTVVQSMFTDKMTFWSISEQAANSNRIKSFNKQVSNQNSMYNGVDQSLVNSLINNMKSLYLDRYLNMKQDISNKAAGVAASNYAEIQANQSTRWMIPAILREWTATDGTSNYVYVPVGDKLEDVFNVYSYYHPDHAIGVPIAESNSDDVESTPSSYEDDGGDLLDLEGKGLSTHNSFSDTYKSSVDYLDIEVAGALRAVSLSTHKYIVLPLVTGNSRANNSFSNISYNAKWYFSADGLEHFSRTSNYKQNHDLWAAGLADELCNRAGTSSDLERMLNSADDSLTGAGSEYSRYKRGTVQPSLGYLFATESPLIYFYSNICDTFEEGINVGVLARYLTGEYVANDITGVERRVTFMADGDGEIRDFLDLEGLFTEVMPFMYSMHTAANGYFGTYAYTAPDAPMLSKLGDAYPIYKDNLAGWVYRCNWVSKLYDNPTYYKPATVYDSNGNKVTISNPLFPQCYPDSRPMVFSRSDMVKQGLTEAALNIVELTLLEISDNVYKQYTLMLNYINVNGITKEVLFRQMGLDATMEFCRQFSPTFSTASKTLYPSSLDLRSISFDSIMKMMLLNSTRNTSYIFGDSMAALIDNSDVITQCVLVFTTALCVWVVPLARNLTFALLFGLAFIQIIKSILESPTDKGKKTLGYMGCTIIVLIINIIYILLFKVMIGRNSAEDILIVGSEGISTGNVMWSLIFIIALSVVYLIVTIRFIVKFLFKSYRDLGYTAMTGLIDTVRDISTNVVHSVKRTANRGVLASEAAGSAGDHGVSGNIPDPSNQGSSGSGGSAGSAGSGGSGGSGGSSSSGSKRHGRRKKPSSQDSDPSSYSDTQGLSDTDDNYNNTAYNSAVNQANSMAEHDTLEIDKKIASGRKKHQESSDNTSRSRSTAQRESDKYSYSEASSASDSANATSQSAQIPGLSFDYSDKK